MLMHSSDRFYVITKFMLPSIRDLNFSKLNYDKTCAYLDNKNTHSSETRKHILDLMQLENSMLMYGIYNVETLEKLINTVHNIHNTTSSHGRLFAG